jgi:hypothetical protein
MTVKFDKEMLLKHRFWILVGVTSVLTMLGIAYLEIYGSEEAEKQKTKLKNEVNKLKAEKGERGPESVKEMAKNADKAKAGESEVWGTSYAQQEKYFRWSEHVESEFQFLNGKFAREIKISKKLDNIKAWPEDKDTVQYGELVEPRENYIRIKTRKGDVVVVQAMAKTVVTVDGDAKPYSWDDIARLGKNAMLAITYQKGMYFNDPLTSAEKDVFAKSYVEQIHHILKSVDPLDDKGNGVVQLKNWLYDKNENFVEYWDLRFIRVAKQPWELNKVDISTEAWIAQEDLWIQKEIYRIIRSANDDVAIFKWDSGDKKLNPKDLKGAVAEKRDTVYRFKNSSFALELVLQKDDKLSFTVKNLLSRKQKLDLNFRVVLNNEAGRSPEIIRISDVPLNPVGDKDKKDAVTKIIPVAKDAKDAAPRKGIYGVEQVLTWETAAVKRIDHVSIGSNDRDDVGHSHRTFAEDLRPFVMLGEQPPVAPVAPGAEPKKEVIRPKGRGRGPKGGAAAVAPLEMVDRGPGGVNRKILDHELWTDRYVEVTDQSRRVPVAVALIVDQDHVDRVLTAFNNSKLRFLETQVLLNHYPSSLQPIPVEKKEEAPPVVVGPKRKRADPPPPNPQSSSSSSADGESNMEIVIYGIMTLYQRYPPRALPAPEKK